MSDNDADRQDLVLTVKAPIVKYLRGGTRVGSPTNLNKLWGIMAQMNRKSQSERRTPIIYLSISQVCRVR